MNLVPGLANVAAPTLILAGRQDPMCPVAHADEIHAGLAKSQAETTYEIVEACGHGTWRDQPDKTEAILRTFLA